MAALAGTAGGRVESTGRVEGEVAPLPADSVDLYLNGSEKFPPLLAEMASAKRYIHVMYLEWDRDALTAQVTEVRLERLKEDVQVHILYDWLTCVVFKKDELKRLASAGAVVAACYKRLPQMNYRNHRKMAIIDGKSGKSVYSGGMNMAQKLHRRRTAL